MKTVLIFATVALVLAGCGGDAKDDDGTVTVAAAFYPLAEAARQVGGDRVRVTDLTPPGAEPHDLELTSDQVDTLLDADLVVLMGRGFQPGVEDVADDRDDPTISVLAALDVAKGSDPHVWLDPTKYADIISLVADGLATADPDGAATYRANASTYEAKLDALDGDVKAGLAACDRRVIVTAHEAFGWLAAHYGLEQEAIAGMSPDQEPDPARIAELEALVRRDGLTTVFTEELLSPEVADALAREAHVQTAVLNPLESQPKKGDYITVMRDSLAALEKALGCA